MIAYIKTSSEKYKKQMASIIEEENHKIINISDTELVAKGDHDSLISLLFLLKSEFSKDYIHGYVAPDETLTTLIKTTITKEELIQRFFYLLLRDAAKAGDVEFVMREFEKDCSTLTDKIEYSNKHIAGYAEELTKRFLSAIKPHEKA